MLCGLLATLCFVSPDLNVFKDLLFTAGHYHPLVLSELLVKSPRIDQAISLSRSTLLIFTSCVGRAGNAFKFCVCDFYPDLGRLRQSIFSIVLLNWKYTTHISLHTFFTYLQHYFHVNVLLCFWTLEEKVTQHDLELTMYPQVGLELSILHAE